MRGRRRRHGEISISISMSLRIRFKFHRTVFCSVQLLFIQKIPSYRLLCDVDPLGSLVVGLGRSRPRVCSFLISTPELDQTHK